MNVLCIGGWRLLTDLYIHARAHIHTMYTIIHLYAITAWSVLEIHEPKGPLADRLYIGKRQHIPVQSINIYYTNYIIILFFLIFL